MREVYANTMNGVSGAGVGKTAEEDRLKPILQWAHARCRTGFSLSLLAIARFDLVRGQKCAPDSWSG